MNAPPPLISVILCTRDRPESFQRALASVYAQDAEPFEVVVIDGSRPAVDVCAPAQIPTRVITGEWHGEGRARAAGLRQLPATSSPGATTTRSGPQGICAGCAMHRRRAGIDVVHARGSRSAPPRLPAPHEGGSRPPASFAVSPSDVLHRASAARLAGGLDHHLHAFAGNDLLARIAERAGVLALDCVLTVQHAERSTIDETQRCAALERLTAHWSRDLRRRSESTKLLTRRQRRLTDFNPETWSQGRRELLVQTVLKPPASFALVSRALIPALQALDVRVTLGPLREGRLDAAWRSVEGSAEPQDRLGLVYDFRVGPAALHSERVAYYAMWATTSIPAFQVDEINRAASMLYVPCQENARTARSNGVYVPTRVLPHGIDPVLLPYIERRRAPNEPYTFGSTSVFHIGKGIDRLIRAFVEEFGSDEPVQLALNHSYLKLEIDVPDDPRIALTNTFLDSAGMLRFYAALDAYVLPTRGEGFGLTGLEAMATGLPLIATNWSGPVEYLDPADSFPLRYRLVEAGGIFFQFRRQFGYWAEPDVEHLRELMRYLYEHRAEAADAGQRASARVHRDWTWARVARQVVADFDLLAQGVTPVES